MTGQAHVTLNGEKYMLAEPISASYHRAPYNPMAAQVGGGGEYDDLQEWSAWAMTDWRAGVGRKDADEGGVAYAEAETRFRNALTLPMAWGAYGYGTAAGDANPIRTPEWAESVTGSDVYYERTIAAGEKWAIPFSHTSGHRVFWFWLYADIPTGVTVQVDIYVGGDIATATLWDSYDAYTTPSGKPGRGLRWHQFALPSPRWVQPSGSTSFWFVVAPTGGDIRIVQQDTNLAGGGWAYERKWNGASWGYYADGLRTIMAATLEDAVLGDDDSDGPQLHCISKLHGWTGDGNGIFVFSDDPVSTHGNDVPYYFDAANGGWIPGTDGPTTTSTGIGPTAAVNFGGYLWFALTGGTHSLYKMSPTGVNSATALNATLVATHNGYLWRAYQNDVYYTGDGSTWTGPIEVGPDGYEIVGMAGMGDSLYVSTEEGLWVVLPGDFVSGVSPWPSVDSANGRGMINWMGSLYIPVGHGLVRYTPDGQLIQMGLDQDDGLPLMRAGAVRALAGTTNWLLAMITPDETPSVLFSTTFAAPSIWAWNGEGWHHMATLPDMWGSTASLYYDRAENFLWFTTGQGVAGRLYLPDNADDPTRATNVLYMPAGWVEFPTFHAGLREIQKDFESVFIDGENIDSNRWVKVYWKDDDSTDWEYLGQITSNRQELRWSSAGTRPNSRTLRIGLELFTNDPRETPIVRGIRIKFHPMLTDLFRWSLAIRVGDYIEYLNHEKDTRTAFEIEDDLETAMKSVPPVTYVDVDGTSYTVKVESGSLGLGRVEYRTPSWNSLAYEGVYRIGLRQVVAN